MKLSYIQKSITILLHEKFPTYKIVLDQQCDVTKPTFFVSIRKLNTDNYRTYKNKTVNVSITYVNKEYDHVENNDVNDKLDNLFKLTLEVNGNFLRVDNLDFSEPDALICTFTLEFNEPIEEEQSNTVKMEELFYRE